MFPSVVRMQVITCDFSVVLSSNCGGSAPTIVGIVLLSCATCSNKLCEHEASSLSINKIVKNNLDLYYDVM